MDQTEKTDDMQQMTLYMYPDYRSQRCIWLAKEMGIMNNMKTVEMFPQDPDKEKVESYKRDVHPHGTIPALVLEDGRTIIESGAICLYLADRYGRLLPEKQWTAEYYNWIMYASITLDEMMEHLFTQWMLKGPEQEDKDIAQKMADKFKVFAEYFNNFLKGKAFICGDKFTAADCVMGYNIWWASVMREGCLINDWPEIIRYRDGLKSRDAFKQAFTTQPLQAQYQ
ncbi:glutathione S-transferase GstA-like isoform X1 [Argopecten irradians]|uniref:glutathione S-transferase GstA-like isoform X1 n=2 Tax=Argopecten irradians TaxID=31199 RepID=UPI00371E7ABD